MEKTLEEQKEKTTSVKEFGMTENRLISQNKKRKNWTTPGVNRIQNFLRKRFRLA